MTESFLTKFVDDAKLGGVANILKNRIRIQMDLDTSEQLAKDNEMKTNARCYT